MRQALVASVWGAVSVALAFAVLIFPQSGPVGAQTDPLAGETANITATDIGITVADCEADPNATVVSLTVADAANDATQETFTEGDNADFQFGSQGITITPQGDDLGDLEGVTTGTVVSSEGITCGDATGGNGGNGGGGGDNENATRTAAELQYNIIIETIPNKLVLANTGGWPILAGAALMLVASVIVGARVIGRR